MSGEETVVICSRITTPLTLPDNRIGKCHECGCRVQFRPHAPHGRRLCLDCAIPLIENGVEVMMTPQMVEDLMNWLRKKLQ